jgi:DNA polymerase III alpha subunit (gram-positive type)
MFKPTDIFCICDFETTGVDCNLDYPIEVGVVFTDSNFILKDTVDELIMWDELHKECSELNSEKLIWPSKYLDGYKYAHKIEAEEWLQNSKSVNYVAEKIYNICEKLRTKDCRLPIIVSDNAMFEYNFMKKLFDNSDFDFPFHYTAWGTNLLVESSKTSEYKPIHRAFPDCCDQYHMVMRMMERYNFFNEKLFYER